MLETLAVLRRVVLDWLGLRSFVLHEFTCEFELHDFTMQSGTTCCEEKYAMNFLRSYPQAFLGMLFKHEDDICPETNNNF